MASIYDRNLQESTLFELFKSDAYTDTIKALKLAQQEIVTKILSIKGDTWSRRRLVAVKKVIDQEITAAFAGTLSTLQKELPNIAEVTAKNMLLKSFVSVPVKTINAITSNTFMVQGYEAKRLFKTTSDNHARQLQVLIGSGVAQGKTSQKLINELITKNSSLSRGQLKNAIFTTITEARATTRHASYKHMEKSGVITGYQYVATLDGRTSEYCRNHDGRNYPPDIEAIQKDINTHFHCRSIFAPTTKSSDTTVRASQFGQVPDETYSVWFSRQSGSFQKSVLGKRKFEAYQTGSYKIGGLPDVVGKAMALEAVTGVLSTTAKETISLQNAKDKAEELSFYSGMDKQNVISTTKFLKNPPDIELAYSVSNTFHGDYFEDFVEKAVNIENLFLTQDRVFLKVVLDKLDNPIGRLTPAIVSYKNKLYVVNGHHRLAARWLEGNKKTDVRIFTIDKLED